MLQAVITADIIDYTKLSVIEGDQVIHSIHDTIQNLKDIRTNLDAGNFTISRGDNIQLELSKPEEALNAALLLKSSIKKSITENKNKPVLDARIAIGIGEILGKRTDVNVSTGDAYTFSGRTLDAMKKMRRTLAIKTYDPVLNDELETELKLLEVIIAGWTINAAEVMYWTLLGFNEQEMGDKLNITQSAINQRKKTAGWVGIEPLLKRFKELMIK